MIEKYCNVRLSRAVVDIAFNVAEKEIFLPDISDGLQFSLNNNNKPVGVLRIDTDEKFLEFFNLIKKSKFYEDFEKIDLSRVKAL